MSTPFGLCVRRGVLPFLLLFAAGCGGSYGADVWGEITFDGKPVPAGRIYFNPDFTKGNDGQQGFAAIKDGNFDTRNEGQAAIGGPTVVIIQGYNGVAKPDDPTWIGDPIFEPYKVQIDLPKEPSEQKFEVPASAGKSAPRLPKNDRKI